MTSFTSRLDWSIMEYYFCFWPLLPATGTKEVTTKRRLRSEEEEEAFATLWCFLLCLPLTLRLFFPPLWRSFSGRPERIFLSQILPEFEKGGTASSPLIHLLLLSPLPLSTLPSLLHLFLLLRSWRKVLLLLLLLLLFFFFFFFFFFFLFLSVFFLSFLCHVSLSWRASSAASTTWPPGATKRINRSMREAKVSTWSRATSTMCLWRLPINRPVNYRYHRYVALGEYILPASVCVSLSLSLSFYLCVCVSVCVCVCLPSPSLWRNLPPSPIWPLPGALLPHQPSYKKVFLFHPLPRVAFIIIYFCCLSLHSWSSIWRDGPE